MVVVDKTVHDYLDQLHPCVESQILVFFATLEPNERILEIGCGTGFISLALACYYPDCSEIAGIDIDSKLIEKAKQFHKGLEPLLNRSLPIRFVLHDASSTKRVGKLFHAVVCNPPFFKKKKTRPSPAPERRHARQDETLSIDTLFHCALLNLRKQGKLFIVMPMERREEIITKAEENNFQLVEEYRRTDIRKKSGGVVFFSFQKKESS